MNLTILQWNVWYQEKADSILEFLRQTDADILCLQELTQDSFINSNRNLPQEIAALGYEFHYEATIERSGPEHMHMGNGIFSKFPIHNRRSTYVQRADNSPDTVDKENRIYLEVQLAVGQQTLSVGTAHLSYTRGYIESAPKAREIEVLLPLLTAHSSRYVFTCDSNALPGSLTMQQIDSVLQNAGPDYSQNTWTTKRHEFTDLTMEGLNWRVDYVFVTPDVEVVSSKTLQTDYSDHLPILTTINLSRLV